MLRRIAKSALAAIRRRRRSREEVRAFRRRIAELSRPVASRPHGLPGELIISLTSYPPRFSALPPTLRSLANQTVAPDRIILWLADPLPWRLRRLAGRLGVEVRLTADTRSFKKLLPALERFPDAFIVTADDDNFYKPDWLETLVRGWEPGTITFWRGHRVPFADPIPPYADWQWNVEDDDSRRPSPDLMPTGLGGILYPPGSLHADVLTDEYHRLCPRADDIWFWWHARRAGTLHKKVGGAFEELAYAQHVSLWAGNIEANDHQMSAMIGRYGLPGAAAFQSLQSRNPQSRR